MTTRLPRHSALRNVGHVTVCIDVNVINANIGCKTDIKQL